MASLESAVPAQPIVKDVQTLKANLKEQEKRARSENEAQEVIPDADPKTAADEESRKRRKVSNPTEPNQGEPEVVVLDGPLPPAKEQPKTTTPKPSSPSKKLESPAAPQKDAGIAADKTSPSKVAKAAEPANAPKPVDNTTAPSEVKNGQPEAVSKCVESPQKPVASKDESQTKDPKCSTEEAKETVTAASEVKEPATIPAEAGVASDKPTSS